MAKSASAYFTRNTDGKVEIKWRAGGWVARLTNCSGKIPLITGAPSQNRREARSNLDCRLIAIAQEILRCKTDYALRNLLERLGFKFTYSGVLNKDYFPILFRHPLDSVRRYAKGVLARALESN